MTSLRTAVDSKCRECIYDVGAIGTWRQQIQDCTAKKCPLYKHRPLPIPPRGKGEGLKALEISSDNDEHNDSSEAPPKSANSLDNSAKNGESGAIDRFSVDHVAILKEEVAHGGKSTSAIQAEEQKE